MDTPNQLLSKRIEFTTQLILIMARRISSIPHNLLLVAVLGIGAGRGFGEQTRVSLDETVPSNWLLRHPVRSYQNYAFDPYTNYLHHTVPQGAAIAQAYLPRAFYDGTGNHLITGYDLFGWTERRQPALDWGSAITKDEGTWTEAFAYIAIGQDGYGDWNYSAIVGDALTARFTPLTLSLVDFSGLRFDLSTPHLKLTTLASRHERPYAPRGSDYYRTSEYHIESVMFAGASSLHLGGRMQTDIGNASLGLNLANLHTYDSGQPGHSIKGILRPGQPLIDWVVVRFSDDSPRDGRGGAVIQDVELIVNGEERQDIVPYVIRHRAGVSTQVGRYSVATGEFTATPYFTPTTGHRTFYRGRSEIALYADYLYRLDHEAGVDVSSNTNLSGLVSTFIMESAAPIQRTDGDEQLAYLFDLSQEPYLESIEVAAMVGNDYRVDVTTLWEDNPRGKGYDGRFKSEFYRTVLRAHDNVQDLSNLKRVRFRIGEDTAMFTYSADVSLRLVGLELAGEYARSSVFRRYPAESANEPILDHSPRFADRGSAYYVNATRWGRNWGFGGEYFAMNPQFTTTMRSFVEDETILRNRRSPIRGLSNETIYWDFVQDNEDGDQFPDKRPGYTTGQWFLNDDTASGGVDPDGAYIGQDADNDGYPDINRNGDALPDYLEPFLMYQVEPNDYTYGFDRNNNDEPDQREDDWAPDHPYDPDQRGYHVFGQTNLTRNWTLALGRYDVEEIAGSGMNRSTYALLTYRREGPDRMRRLFFENHFRRVNDSIPDEYNVFTDDRQFTGEYRYFVHNYYWGNRSFLSRARQDPLWYENSYVNEAYLENWLQPWSTLNIVQKIRLRVNWQQGGFLSGGIQGWGPLPYHFADKQRPLDSFKRRTLIASVTNGSRYFGYELFTIVGLIRDAKQFDSATRATGNFDSLSLFVRALVGFPDHANLLL